MIAIARMQIALGIMPRVSNTSQNGKHTKADLLLHHEDCGPELAHLHQSQPGHREMRR
jgi:hypothetical protein